MSLNHLSYNASQAAKKYFQKRFPYKSQKTYTQEEWKSVESKYPRVYAFTILLGLILLTGLPFLYGALIFNVYVFIGNLIITPPDIFFPTNWGYFVLVGAILTFCTITFPVKWVQRLFLGEKYAVFEDYHNRKERYDDNTAGMWILKIFIVPFFIGLYFVATSHVIISEKHFSVKMFYQLIPHKYDYGSIRKATFYSFKVNKKGEEYLAPHYKIFLANNVTISPDFHFDNIAGEEKFIRLLKTKVDTIAVDTN